MDKKNYVSVEAKEFYKDFNDVGVKSPSIVP